MKRILAVTAIIGFLSISADAGVLKVATFPVRHFVKTAKTVFRVATFPVRHPVKTVF